MFDTDIKIGSSDPNSVTGNPGFEFEIRLKSGGGKGVYVDNVDGTTNGTNVSNYTLATNSQKVQALSQDPACGAAGTAIFYQFFIPITDLGINYSTQFRLVCATASSPGSVLGGSASDIAGTDDNSCFSQDSCFIELINLQGGGTTLAVDLLSFDAINKFNKIALTWKATSEENISHFDIERSSDGKEFAKIEEVKAGLKYVFHDYKPENGVNYYRLKIVGDDNSFSYSKVKEVTFGDDVFVSLFPNPTNDFSTLKVTGDYDKLQLTVFDLKGRLIKQANYFNQNQIELEIVSDLADGMYHINLTIDNYISKNIKLVKNK